MFTTPRHEPRLIRIPAGIAVLVALVAGVVAPRAARAQSPDDKDIKTDKDVKAAAKEHYRRGTSYYDVGRYAEAIKEFEAAYELKNDAAFLYNLAQSYRLAGDAEQALHVYRRYLPHATNRAEIEGRIKALEQQLGQKAAPATQPSDPNAPPALPVPEAAGPSSIASPPTYNPAPPVTVLPAPISVPPAPVAATSPPVAATPLSLGPTPPPVSGAPASEAPPPPAGHRFQIAGLVTAGGGGLLILVGIVEALRARSASHEVEDEAAKMIPFVPAVQERGQAAETAEAWALSLGAIAAAGGAALWYYGRRVNAAAEGPTINYKISFGPVISSGGGGGWLRVGF